MKKSCVLFLLALMILIYQFAAINGQSSSVGIGLILMDITGPIIKLIGPINNSGNIEGNIIFFYNASDESDVSSCSLIINNKLNLTNTTIIKNAPIYFKLSNLSVGSYNWSINCTDSQGNVGKSSQLSLGSCSFKKFNGSSTNISAFNIRNLTNFNVEISTFGKIGFIDAVDLGDCSDFNKYINISNNFIGIDSAALSFLNKSAVLQIYGLTFSNPRILINNFLCPSDVCSKLSYSGGILSFNVSHFTSYSSEETPVESSSSSSTGGGGGGVSGGGDGTGGGGTAPTLKPDFNVNKENLKIVLKQGGTAKEILYIKNTGTSIFDVKTDLSELGKFKISPEADEITTSLNLNEQKPIELIFKALDNQKPDVYTGKIILKGASIEKEIPTTIEVDSAQPLFDVAVNVLPKTKRVLAGEQVLLEVSLYNIRGFGRVDVVVEYIIKDLKENVIASEHETLAVETQAKFTRSILVPSTVLPGTYVAYAKVTYGDSVGVGSSLFEVAAKSIKLYPIPIQDYKWFVILFGAVILALNIFIFSAHRYGYFKKKAPESKGEEIKDMRAEEKEQKLKKEMGSLEEAYKSGFISEESYQKDKKRIQERLGKFR